MVPLHRLGPGTLSRRGFLAAAGAACWCAGCGSDAPKTGAAPKPQGGVAEPAPAPPPPPPLPEPVPYRIANGAEKVVVYFHKDHPFYPLPAGFDLPPATPKPPTFPGVPKPLLDFEVGNRAAPVYVQLAARCAENVLGIWTGPGAIFRKPRRELEIHLDDLDRLGIRGGTHPDYEKIWINFNQNPPDLYATIAHEIFHRIQIEYGWVASWAVFRPPLPKGEGGEYQLGLQGFFSVAEGTARAFEPLALPGYDRLIEDGAAWIDAEAFYLFDVDPRRRGQPLPSPYADALFFAYFDQVNAGQAPGSGLRSIIDTTHPAPGSESYDFRIDDLRAARGTLPKPGHFDQVLQAKGTPAGSPGVTAPYVAPFVSADTDWGNFACALALLGSTERDSRFALEAALRWQLRERPRLRIPDDNIVDFSALPVSRSGTSEEGYSGAPELTWEPEAWSSARVGEFFRPVLRPRAAPIVEPALFPYAFRAWRIRKEANAEAAELLRVRFVRVRGLMSEAGETAALVQLLLLGPSGALVDLVRFVPGHDGEADRVVNCAAASEILVLVSSREYAGDFRLGLSRVTGRALLFATNWNCIRGRHRTVDPGATAWTWRSPDFSVWEGDDGRAEIRLRISNHGDAAAQSVRVAIHAKRIDQVAAVAPWVCLDGFPVPALHEGAGRSFRPGVVETAQQCVERDFNDVKLRGNCVGDLRWPTEVQMAWKWDRLKYPGGAGLDMASTCLMARIVSSDNAEPQGVCILTSPSGRPPSRPDGLFYAWPDAVRAGRGSPAG